MSTIQPKIVTDQWVTATWDEYIQIADDPAYEKAKGYYHNGQMRIEMAALGHDDASDNAIISFLINLLAGIRGIPLKCLINCTFRKTGVRDCQPDISYYIGERVNIVPRGTNIVNLDIYQPPDLAIELGKTTIADDLGRKRIMYEDLEIFEYWVVDVEQVDYLGLGGRQFIGNPKRPKLSVYKLVDGEYQVKRFGEDDRIESPTFSELKLTAKQVFQAQV